MNNSNTIIIDSNIIQYLGHKYLQMELDNYINTFVTKKILVAISQITIAEVFSGLPEQKETETLLRLSKFSHIDIQKNILYVAAQLQTLYHKEKIPFQHISLADRIIAATAIYTNSSILTADINDFPRPFFTEVEEKLFPLLYLLFSLVFGTIDKYEKAT